MDELAALAQGDLTVKGRMPWSSNYTFLVKVEHLGQELRAVYKPEEGEQPLDDFPSGLYRREVAAYELANLLGWPNVPPTIVREGPFGIGSLQLFKPADYEQHYFTLLEQKRHEPLIDISIFDVVANNADRKAGHCLAGEDGLIYAIDNGLCFNTEPKLRTVIWDFGGLAVTEKHLKDLETAKSAIPKALDILDSDEIEATITRINELNSKPVLPSAHSQWQFPWPLI